MRLFLFVLLFTGLLSCSAPHREFTSVEVETVYSDSVSIRAIRPLDSSRVWFAASDGRVGLIDGTTPRLATIKYNDTLLNFRALAYNGNAVFVMSAGNPAVLYKIGFDGKEATFIEEVYAEEGPGVFYDAMAFWNENEGIAMGDPVGNCLSVVITRDGGNNWHKLDCTMLPPTEKGEAAFAASNSNIALIGDHTWLVTGGARARVFYSPDKGASWEVNNTPIVQGRTMTGIYSVDFYDRELGVIFGGDWDQKMFNEGNKAFTRDGGRTWRLVANGEGPGYRSSVRFVPGTNGHGIVATGSEGLSYSPDQGASWIQLSDEAFYALEFVNDSLAFASGKGRIARIKFRP